ncbi:MAG: hypothetical protein J5J00_09245 [Deltaproteobacteria bacterium]|nr:hypothetical protein [Deltaproteobacteria bacterium]
MSYANFKRELEEELSRREFSPGCDHSVLRQQIDEASRVVFDRWMKARKYDELVGWLIENFDSGGGSSYISALSNELIGIGDRELLRKLWRSVICSREKSFWAWSQMPSAKGADQQISSLLAETNWSFEEYISEVRKSGPAKELEELEEAFSRFKRGVKSKLARKFI